MQKLATRTRVVVLQHPRERDKPIGTARIAAQCLTSAEIFVGVDFAGDARLKALLADEARPAVLLYPGPSARDLAAEPPEGPVTLVVIDGTWHQARSLLRRNPELSALPRYAFTPPRPSEYRIRRAPRVDYVSTIEAVAFSLALLEGDPARGELLLAPFRSMVDVQLDFAARSTGGRKRERRRNTARARPRLPDALLDARLVCVGGEANAWPHQRATRKPPYPHELVHWVARRASGHPAGGARFEAFIAPREPLSTSPFAHARLSPAQLRSGLSIHDFRAAWSAFAGPDDVFCCWGPYAVELLAREGISLSRLVDLRKVVGDYLKLRPGSLEALVEARGLAFTPQGSGRGGERLGMLTSVCEWLAAEARSGARNAREHEIDSEAQAGLRVHE